MCDKHEQLYKGAAEELQAFRILEDQIRDKTADDETIIKYMRTMPPPRAYTDLSSIEIKLELIDRMAKSSPPFPVGGYFLWFGEMYSLFHDFPTDTRLLENLEAAAALCLESERGSSADYRVNSALAECYFDAKLYRKAIETFKKTKVQETVCNPASYTKALVETGEYQEAYVEFVKFSNTGFTKEMDPESVGHSGPEIATILARILEGLGQTEQAAKWRKCILKWAEYKVLEGTANERLPKWLQWKLKGLLPEEKEIIKYRFGFDEPPRKWRELGGSSYEKVALILAPFVDVGFDEEADIDPDGEPNIKYEKHLEPDDVEFVKHVEHEALKHLGMTFEELMSICHPGFVCTR